MAAITAQVVNEFRKRTGLGLMECKTLLVEADGDPKKAETLAKERGLKNAEKRAGRAATAGRVEALMGPGSRSGAIIELGCETDFVARNDDFRQAARDFAQHVLETGSAAPDQPFHKDPSKTIKDVLIELNARTGENVTLSRFARFTVDGEGRVDAYVHHDAKSGALVEAHGPADAALVKDLALQVVAAKPPSPSSGGSSRPRWPTSPRTSAPRSPTASSTPGTASKPCWSSPSSRTPRGRSATSPARTSPSPASPASSSARPSRNPDPVGDLGDAIPPSTRE